MGIFAQKLILCAYLACNQRVLYSREGRRRLVTNIIEKRMIKENFVQLLEDALKEHWALPIFTNYEAAKSYNMSEVAEWIQKVHLLLKEAGINEGDKVALLSKDSAEWCMTWLGIVTYGAVIVPILPEFHGEDIWHIIRHSDSRALFLGEEHRRHFLTLSDLSEQVVVTFGVEDLVPIAALTRLDQPQNLDAGELFVHKFPNGLKRDAIALPTVSNEKVVLISYTSGTTGFSKGVMTTANNLAANLKVTLNEQMFERGKSILCFLPNAHAYSCAFNFLLPFVVGCHVYILGSKPIPSVLLKAFRDVRPHIILSVPLVLEKIYKNVIVPKIKGAGVRIALGVPLLNNVIYKKIREGLLEALGGNVKEIIIGGAALNEEVGAFLDKAKVPISVGYGMTECAPLISYVNHRHFVQGSCGKVLHMIEEVRIAEAKDVDGTMVGEVQVRGENVCKGYYNEPKLTEELFTADGWMHTGDLGYIDKHDNLFLKGRSKSMILGPNGQNIYPEEIEAKIAMLPYMSEAIVVHRNGQKLVAIVTMDEVALRRDKKESPAECTAILQENRQILNSSLASFAQVADFELLDGEFAKTPKQSIQRYLYQ